MIGAAAGVGLSIVLVRLIVVAGSEYVPYADELSIDWKVLAFAIAMAFVASALASLAPLWQAVRTPPNAVLTEGVRASAGGPVRKVSQALVVAEIALAFTLLTVSVILVVHLRNLGRVPTGFDPRQPADVSAQRARAGRPDRDRSVPFQKRLIEALEAIPGVTSAAVVNQLPLDGCCMGGTVHVEGRPPGDEGASRQLSLRHSRLPAGDGHSAACRQVSHGGGHSRRRPVCRRQPGGSQSVLAGSESGWRHGTVESA